jgi:hypothetical protein
VHDAINSWHVSGWCYVCHFPLLLLASEPVPCIFSPHLSRNYVLEIVLKKNLALPWMRQQPSYSLDTNFFVYFFDVVSGMVGRWLVVWLRLESVVVTSVCLFIISFCVFNVKNIIKCLVIYKIMFYTTNFVKKLSLKYTFYKSVFIYIFLTEFYKILFLFM